jgi:hypothetical protein
LDSSITIRPRQNFLEQHIVIIRMQGSAAKHVHDRWYQVEEPQE